MSINPIEIQAYFLLNTINSLSCYVKQFRFYYKMKKLELTAVLLSVI